MKKVVAVFRALLLSIIFFLSFWICLVSIHTNSNSSYSVHQSERKISRRNFQRRPTFFDDFCGNFTRNVSSEIYLNYTLNSNIRAAFFTQARLARRVTQFHIAIHSSPRNFKARRTIRRTWKKLFHPKASCGSFATLAFYVGKTADNTTAAWLEREFREHPDDMVLIDFCDAYENLPLKTFNVMSYVNEHIRTVEFVLKLDDDVLPNIHLLSRCFTKVIDPDYGLYGFVTLDAVPDPKGKYGLVPGRYFNRTLPPFTHGPAYAIRRENLTKLLDAASRTPVINLEDVWFTGMVADAAGIQRMNVTRFLQMYRRPSVFEANAQKSMTQAFFFHRVSQTTVTRMWSKYPQNCDDDVADSDLCSDFMPFSSPPLKVIKSD